MSANEREYTNITNKFGTISIYETNQERKTRGNALVFMKRIQSFHINNIENLGYLVS